MDALQRTQQQLVQSAKLAAIGELAAGVAHELNNPLTVILGHAQLLHTKVDAELGQKLQKIAVEALRASKITRGLLDFSRRREPKHEPVSVNALVPRALELIQSKLRGQDIRVEANLSADTPDILGDADQLTQVLINLMGNAIDAMARSGTLTVRTTVVDDGLELAVSDTGSGMDAEQANRIFEPFYTTKAEGKGTGLGLSVTLGILKSHGGSIAVDSTKGSGTTMRSAAAAVVRPRARAGDGRMKTLDALAARLYAAGYDATVSGFGPYERLADEIADFIERGVGGGSARVLDVACGTGTLAQRLARRGHVVTGIDAVPGLVEAARHRSPVALANRLAFTARDVALAGPPGVTAFDAVVALHTLYWHPYPERLLRACWAALRPGGHAIVVAYGRAATVRRTLAAVCRADGAGAAVGALRWLVPTAAFEALRRIPKRYVDEAGIRGHLTRAGFVVRETRSTFLGGVSLIAWAQREQTVGEGGAVGAPAEIFQQFPNGRR